jgi:hypothetical protein
VNDAASEQALRGAVDGAVLIHRDDVDDRIIVGPQARRRPAFLRLLSVGEGRSRRQRERQPVIPAVIADIAVHFEIASEGLELRAERPDMAGGAGLAGLHREGGNRMRRIASERGGDQQEQKSRAAGLEPAPNHVARALLVGGPSGLDAFDKPLA